MRREAKGARGTRKTHASSLAIKLVNIDTALKRLKTVSDEIRYAACFESPHFTSGIIAFRPTRISNSKQIKHADKDVVCHVIQGAGRLRTGARRIRLHPGMLCHIAKNTPHDFSAARTGELVLFYSLIES